VEISSSAQQARVRLAAELAFCPFRHAAAANNRLRIIDSPTIVAKTAAVVEWMVRLPSPPPVAGLGRLTEEASNHRQMLIVAIVRIR
jgi:hypothetical protein